MTSTLRISKQDELDAAKRVVNSIRPGELDLLDDVELETYYKAKQIIQEYYGNKRSSQK